MAGRIRTQRKALVRLERLEANKKERKALNAKIELTKKARREYDLAHRGVLRIKPGQSIPDLRKVLPGDIFASIDTRSLFSKSIAKAINSPYSHVGVFVDKKPDGKLIVKDFKKGKAGILRNFDEAHKKGVNYVVMRWENATPKQMSAFMKNVERINGKYDVPLAVAYGVETQLKRLFGVKVNLKWDIDKWWTCSEQISHAADPSPKMLASGIFFPVEPPLKPNPNMDRNKVSPRTLVIDGVNNRVLKVITLRNLS